MNNPLYIREYSKSHLVEAIMSLRGRSVPNPRRHRTLLEGLRYDQLETIYYALMAQWDGKEQHEN